jgi:hypothetical protein
MTRTCASACTGRWPASHTEAAPRSLSPTSARRPRSSRRPTTRCTLPAHILAGGINLSRGDPDGPSHLDGRGVRPPAATPISSRSIQRAASRLRGQGGTRSSSRRARAERRRERGRRGRPGTATVLHSSASTPARMSRSGSRSTSSSRTQWRDATPPQVVGEDAPRARSRGRRSTFSSAVPSSACPAPAEAHAER